jgi:CBS domain-containing protein
MQAGCRRAALARHGGGSRGCEGADRVVPGLGTIRPKHDGGLWHAPCSVARMETLRSCEHLRREHLLIGEVVAGLDALAERRRSGSRVPALPVTGAIDFFSGFVAGYHEAKEEQGLFPALIARSTEGDGVVAMLRTQHEEGERLLGALRPLSMRQRVDGGAWTLLEAYLAFVREHITSEDDTLLPLAERVLSHEDDAALERAFAEIEDRTVGRAGCEALVSLASAVVHAATALATEATVVRAEILAREVMRSKPATVRPDESLARVAELMKSLSIRELPVVADRALVGIVTRSDMEPYRGHFEWTAVRAAMTPDPVTVRPGTPAAAVARLLVDRSFNAVPVTEDGELVGIVSRSDVLRGLTAGGPGP